MVAMKGHEDGDKGCYYKLSHELNLLRAEPDGEPAAIPGRGDGK